MLAVPRAALLVAWGNACLAGLVSPDTAAERVDAGGRPHRVRGLPGETDAVSLPLALARLRSSGVRGLRLALPVPGDPTGLPGPPAFVQRAVEAGEAVLTCGQTALGLLPRHEIGLDTPGGDGRTVWHAQPVEPSTGTSPSLAEAERELRETLTVATAALVAMDVSRWRPELADALRRLRDDREMQDALAPGYPPRSASVLALARKVAAIATLAGEDPGAAVSASAMDRRTTVLRDLERACRRAQVAAYNAFVVEPVRR